MRFTRPEPNIPARAHLPLGSLVALAGMLACAPDTTVAVADPPVASEPDAGSEPTLEPDARSVPDARVDLGVPDVGLDASDGGRPDVPPGPDGGTPSLGSTWAALDGPTGDALSFLGRAGDVILLRENVFPGGRLFVSRDGGATFTGERLADIGLPSHAGILSVAGASEIVVWTRSHGLLASAHSTPLSFSPRPTSLGTGDVLARISSVGDRIYGTTTATAAIPSSFVVSDDGGRTFTALREGAVGLFAGSDVLIAQEPFASSLLWSDDDGQTWQTHDAPLFLGDISDDGTNLWAHNRSAGSIYISTDRGRTWAQLNGDRYQRATLHGGFMYATTLAGRLDRIDASGVATPVQPPLPDMVPRSLHSTALGLVALSAYDGMMLLDEASQSWVATGPRAASPSAMFATEDALFVANRQGQLLHRHDFETGGWRLEYDGLEGNFALTAVARDHLGRPLVGDGNSGVLRSSNDGETFRLLSRTIDPDESGSAVYAIVAEPGRLVVGLESWDLLPGAGHGDPNNINPIGGGVFVSTDDGASWMDVVRGLPERIGRTWTGHPTVWDLEPLEDGSIVASIESERIDIYTLRAGETFWRRSRGSALSGDLADRVLDISAFEDRLFARTERGALHASTDGGETWTEASLGLPAGADVTALSADDRHLVLGTRTRGVYVVDRDLIAAPLGLDLPEGEVTSVLVDGARAFAGVDRHGVYELR